MKVITLLISVSKKQACYIESILVQSRSSSMNKSISVNFVQPRNLHDICHGNMLQTTEDLTTPLTACRSIYLLGQ